ncbi:MAG TPA: ABC transporter permease [Vicinamibacterales bacterium]|nr:ABC transporter permease [Vicinamibacterales bacterium]
MLHDLRTAVRAILKDRWLAAAAVFALALGIGVNATVFTLVNAVLIRGLPFEDSARLYVLGTRRLPAEGRGQDPVSYQELQDWRSQARSFADMAAFAQYTMNIADDRGMPEQQSGARVSVNLFRLLGQQPLLGRDFSPEDGQKDAERVAILGHTLWTNRYGADPNILGKAIRINGEPAVIVGVLPPGVKFPTRAELWTQVIPNAENARRNRREYSVAGRVRPGVSRAQAQTELSGIAARLAAEYPDTNKDVGAVMQTFNERFNGGEIRTVFLALQGAVGFVLLIACANVANLQLSRSIRRARDIAVRVALGATRWRVVRQLLVESILIGCLGGALGLLIAIGGVRLFDAAVADVGKPYWIVFSMDYVVFAFLGGICVLTGILFGLAPALQVSKVNVNELLKEGGRGNAGSRRARWLTGTMVVVELALTLVLLVGAGLMVRSFLKIYTADLGIPTEHLLTMRMTLTQAKYPTAESRMAFYDRLAPKLSAIAGTEAVAIATSLPGFGAGRRRMEIDGRPLPTKWEDRPEVGATIVSPAFFRATGIQLIRGRGFSETDGAPGSEVLVVDDRFAAQHFPGEDPIGRRVKFPQRDPAAGQPPPVWRTIVGISRTIEDLPEPGGTQPAGSVYIPYRQEPPGSAGLLVRSRLDPVAIMNAVRREVQSVDPDQPVFTVQTVDEMISRATWPYRVFGSLFAIFALIALVLSAVGLYAVMSYSVTQRTPEIGVRMALGAGRRQVSWLVMRRGLMQLGIGLALGLAGAYGLSQVLTELLTGVTPTDPLTFASITVLLIVVAGAACVIPAYRASRLDPLVALRD